jgi:oxygen-independent coproporphyrinogen III oxidase
MDFIFAIPGQTLASWRNTLTAAIRLGVRHISAYSLSYEENTLLYDQLKGGAIKKVAEETDRKMYELAIDMLNEAGILQYEISNFARVGFECRHNLVYWANRPYIGIGPAAASYWQGTRMTNVSNIRSYLNAVECGQSLAVEAETSDPQETACQTAILNLRRIKGINLHEFHRQTGYDALEVFSEPITRYKSLGFLMVTADSIRLAVEALPIADSILCDFASV